MTSFRNVYTQYILFIVISKEEFSKTSVDGMWSFFPFEFLWIYILSLSLSLLFFFIIGGISSRENFKWVFKREPELVFSLLGRSGWVWFLQIYKLGNLQAGQTSREKFVIWKCLTVRLTFCIVSLLSLQGLNMILSKLDNPEEKKNNSRYCLTCYPVPIITLHKE